MDLHNYIKSVTQQPGNLFTELGHSYQDRYEFNTPDSFLWLDLFWLTDPRDRTLAEKLEYIRGVGTLLMMDSQFGFRLTPIIGVNGWESIEQYNRERQYLTLHTANIISVLKELRRRYDAGIIIGA